MSKTKLDGKFFETTRGQIVMRLRNGGRSVNDLAADLGLTDNAIRANLLTLARDHLVESAGTVKTVRRPYVVYQLPTRPDIFFLNRTIRFLTGCSRR